MTKPKFFSIKRKDGVDEETKLIGANVPISIAEYLALFCLADARSRTSIIQPLILEWAKGAKKKVPEKELTKLAAEKGFAAWKNRKRKTVVFTLVMDRQKKELLKRGISESTASKIISRIQKIKDAENKKS